MPENTDSSENDSDNDSGEQSGPTKRGWNWEQTHNEYIPREIQRMADESGLSDAVANMAEQVHQEAIRAEYEYRHADRLASGALFAAARLQGAAVDADDIAAVSRKDSQAVRSAYRSISRELGLSIEPNNPEPFVARFTSELGFPDESSQRASRLTRDAVEAELTNDMAPKSLAASVCYIVSLTDELDLTQADISDVSGVAPETIRGHYRDIADTLQVNLSARRGMAVVDRRQKPESVEDSIARVREAFNPPSALWEQTEEILSEVEVGGRDPAGVVAGAFWVAVRDEWRKPYNLSQADLSHHLGVSEATIQNRVREFREERDD